MSLAPAVTTPTASVGRAAFALCAWTLFVWLNRIKNVFDDRVSVGGELEGWSFTWRFGVAILFCLCAILGAGLVVAVNRTTSNEGKSTLIAPATRFFAAFAIGGSLWWFVRGISTLFADFSVGFKVVHTVLALVTIGLGLLVLRAARVGVRYG